MSTRAGETHPCGIRTDGTLWCLGNNANGQLGPGDRTHRAAVTQAGTATWAYVDTGSYSTCGVQLNGTLWCWGAGTRDQLGLGDTEERLGQQQGRPVQRGRHQHPEPASPGVTRRPVSASHPRRG